MCVCVCVCVTLMFCFRLISHHFVFILFLSHVDNFLTGPGNGPCSQKIGAPAASPEIKNESGTPGRDGGGVPL